jgi:uncharacterized protein (TIGR02284 family)
MQSTTQSQGNYKDSQFKNDVDQLNSFLRGEISAVETYDQAINKITDSRVSQQLVELRSSHSRRVELLRQRVVSLGGEPSSSSGIWGSFAKAVEGAAATFGVSSAIAALEEGEDHGRDDYRADLKDVSPDTRNFITSSILPEQLRTHSAMSALKRQVASSS